MFEATFFHTEPHEFCFEELFVDGKNGFIYKEKLGSFNEFLKFACNTDFCELIRVTQGQRAQLLPE